jgi:hypothetical protein
MRHERRLNHTRWDMQSCKTIITDDTTLVLSIGSIKAIWPEICIYLTSLYAKQLG